MDMDFTVAGSPAGFYVINELDQLGFLIGSASENVSIVISRLSRNTSKVFPQSLTDTERIIVIESGDFNPAYPRIIITEYIESLLDCLIIQVV